MSALTFSNSTDYIAQFVVNKGDQVVARLPGIAPGASLAVPSNNSFTVVATTVLEGNTYTSSPLTVSGATKFLAQVKQHVNQGTYDFEVQQLDSSSSTQMQFEKTTINPVTFSISQNGVFLQSVVVPNSFVLCSLNISDTYSIYAVINGVTTDVSTTTNANAKVTAVTDTSDLEAGYYTLVIS